MGHGLRWQRRGPPKPCPVPGASMVTERPRVRARWSLATLAPTLKVDISRGGRFPTKENPLVYRVLPVVGSRHRVRDRAGSAGAALGNRDGRSESQSRVSDGLC